MLRNDFLHSRGRIWSDVCVCVCLSAAGRPSIDFMFLRYPTFDGAIVSCSARRNRPHLGDGQSTVAGNAGPSILSVMYEKERLRGKTKDEKCFVIVHCLSAAFRSPPLD
jgi:hypothetical protein